MQILPTSNTGISSAQDAHSGNSARDVTDFMNILSSSMEDAPVEIAPVLDTAPGYGDSGSRSDTLQNLPGADTDTASENDPNPLNEPWHVADAPYTLATSTLERPAEVTPVGDIRFTDSEVASVIKNLEKQGVDKETLGRVAELMNRPGGTTVKEILQAVSGKKPIQLTDGDMQRIASFLDRIDPGAQFKPGILDDLKNGRIDGALGKLDSALAALVSANPSSKLTMDKGELLSLGKAFGMDADALKKLGQKFGTKETLTLTAKEFREFTAPLSLDVQVRVKNQEKALESVAAALKPVVDKARDRLKKEAEASGMKNRRTEQSETLIRDTVTREGLSKTAETATTRSTEGASVKTDEKTGTRTEAKTEAKTDSKTDSKTNAGTAANATVSESPETAGAKSDQSQAEARNGKQPKSETRADAKVEAKTEAQAEKLTATFPGNTEPSEDPWDALLSKLDVQVSATRSPSDAQPLTNPLNVQSTLAQLAAQNTRATAAPNAAHVLSQVEQGVFSALSDGTKRLTLNLNPVELGAVSVILSARNGEVSATLRPERPETAALLAQQADALRQSLEQQGIKVDRVDVQTPQSQSNSEHWQGMDQHNSAQEQQARQQAMQRMRRLGRIHDSEPVTIAAAQAMRQAARSSHTASSVNIVA